MPENIDAVLPVEQVPTFQNETITRIREVKTRLLKEAGYESLPSFDQQFDEWIDLVTGRAGELNKKSGLNTQYHQRELARMKKEIEDDIPSLPANSPKRRLLENLSRGHNFVQTDAQLREGIKKAQPSVDPDNLINDYQHSIFHHQTPMTMEEYTKDLARQGLLYLNIFEEIAQNYDTYAPLITKKMGLTRSMSFEEFLTKHDDPWRFFRHSLASFIDVYKEGLLKKLEQMPVDSEDYQKLSQRYLFVSDFRDRINQPSQLEAMRDSLFYIRLGSRLPKLAQNQYHKDLADDDKVGKIENDFLEAFRPRKEKVELENLEDLTAPVKEREEDFDDLPPAAPTEIIPLQEEPEEEPLQREFILGIAGDTTQIKKEVEGDRGVDFQLQLSQKKREKESGLGYFIRTAASGFWQKSLFAGLFRERERRWRRNILIENSELTHLPEELVEEAMNQGRERAKKRKFGRKLVDGLILNPLAQIFGFDTSQRIEARKWLREQIIKAKTGSDQVNDKVNLAIAGGSAEREAFGARASLKDDEFFRHKKEDRREVLVDQALQQQLLKDFFDLLTPYINGQIDDEQARRIIDDYCSFHGLIRDDQLISLRERLGSKYKALQSRFTTIGSNMRRIAEYLRDNRERFVRDGIVSDPKNVDQWLAACQSTDPQKNLKIQIMVAEAEMSEGGDALMKKRERVAQLLGEWPKSWLEKTLESEKLRWILRFLPETAINEVTAAAITGYATHLFVSRGALKIGGMATGISVIPLIATGVGAPVFVPVAAAAVSAGAVASIREVMRLRRERLTVESQASFGITPTGQEGKLPFFARLMGTIYGRTSREKLLEYAVSQKKASELMEGLINQSGLFAEKDQLTSKLPDNITVDQVKTALRWLAETKARIGATGNTRRRFIQYDAQLSEAQQQEILDGALAEVYERLNHLFTTKPELKQQLGIPAEKNFSDFYRELVDAYYYNLVGDNKSLTADLRASVDILGSDAAKGLISEAEGMAKRDRAFSGLMARKGIHRFFAVAGTGIVSGGLVAAIKHLAVGSPPPWPFHEAGSTIKGSLPIDHHPAISENEWQSKLGEIKLPQGFQAIDSNNDGNFDSFIDPQGHTHLWSQMEIVDSNHNGVIDPGEVLLLRDKNTHEVLFNLVRDPSKDIAGETKEIFKPDFGADGQPKIEVIAGVQTKIPDNTQWVDNHDGTWDLRALDGRGNLTSITLIDNAKIQSDGHIIGTDYYGKHVEFVSGSSVGNDSITEVVEKSMPVSELIRTVDQVHIATENKHFFDFFFKNEKGDHGVVFELRGDKISGQGVGFANVEEAARSGQMVFSLWKLNPADPHHPEMIQIRVDSNNIENFSDNIHHHVGDLDNGFTVGHDAGGSFVTLKLDSHDTISKFEIVDSQGNSLGQVTGAELFKKLINKETLDHQIALHPERGTEQGVLFSNETVEGRGIYNSERISWGIIHNNQNLTLTTIAGHNKMGGDINIIETVRREVIKPEIEAKIDIHPITEVIPARLGYDLVPVESEIISKLGEYAAGFIPTPYTLYAETGKSPDRFVPSAIKPLPIYPFNFQQAGAKVKIKPPLLSLSDQERLTDEQIKNIRVMIDQEKERLSQDLLPVELNLLAKKYQVTEEEMKQTLTDEEKRKKVAAEVITQSLVEKEMANSLLFDKSLWEKTLIAVGKSDSPIFQLINSLITEAVAKPENKDKPFGQLLNEVLQQLIDENKINQENATKIAQTIFTHYLSLYFQSDDGKERLKDRLAKIRQQVLYEVESTVNAPFSSKKDETTTDQLLEDKWRSFDPRQREKDKAGKLEEEKSLGPYHVSAGSDIGEKREKDEDSYLTFRDEELKETLLMVADGMGRHAAGEVASQKATKTAKQRYLEERRKGKERDAALRAAVLAAHQAVVEYNQQQNVNSGTTLVFAVLDDDGSYLVANVGDSRAYKVTDRKAEQITTDHSVVESLIKSGQIKSEERYTHDQRNIILQCLGDSERQPQPDIFTGQLQTGEQLLLCCDGLWEMTRDVDGRVIHQFARSSPNQQEVVRRLIAKANQEGGKDNITVVVAKKVS